MEIFFYIDIINLSVTTIKMSLYFTNHLPLLGGVLSTKTPVEEEKEQI